MFGHVFVDSYNADMLPDLLGETEPGVRVVWISNKEGYFTKTNFSLEPSLPSFKHPASHGFLDLNMDYTAGAWPQYDSHTVVHVCSSSPMSCKFHPIM